VLCPIYKSSHWIKKRTQKFPLVEDKDESEPHKVFITFFDTSILVATSFGCVGIVWDYKNEPQLFLLNFFLEVCGQTVGCSLLSYIYIGRHSRQPLARFVLTLPALILYLALLAGKRCVGDALITQSVTFFKSFGVDCSQDIWQARDSEVILFTNGLHRFSMIGAAMVLLYFLFIGMSMISKKIRLVGALKRTREKLVRRKIWIVIVPWQGLGKDQIISTQNNFLVGQDLEFASAFCRNTPLPLRVPCQHPLTVSTIKLLGDVQIMVLACRRI
jgi:hypothetical protein